MVVDDFFTNNAKFCQKIKQTSIIMKIFKKLYGFKLSVRTFIEYSVKRQLNVEDRMSLYSIIQILNCSVFIHSSGGP